MPAVHQFGAHAKKKGLLTDDMIRRIEDLVGWNTELEPVLERAIIEMLEEAKGNRRLEMMPKEIVLHVATTIQAFKKR
jgi:hypothetical protein